MYFLQTLGIVSESPVWVKEGQAHHKRQSELFKRRTLKRFGLEEAEFSDNVYLESERYPFYGICDALIQTQSNVYPVEIKLHGSKIAKAHKMQLIAYGMLAADLYSKEFNLGFVLYENNAKTVPVSVTSKDKQEVLALADRIVGLIQSGVMPHSSASPAKCTQCEFENYCNDRF